MTLDDRDEYIASLEFENLVLKQRLEELERGVANVFSDLLAELKGAEW